MACSRRFFGGSKSVGIEKRQGKRHLCELSVSICSVVGLSHSLLDLPVPPKRKIVAPLEQLMKLSKFKPGPAGGWDLGRKLRSGQA